MMMEDIKEQMKELIDKYNQTIKEHERISAILQGKRKLSFLLLKYNTPIVLENNILTFDYVYKEVKHLEEQENEIFEMQQQLIDKFLNELDSLK